MYLNDKHIQLQENTVVALVVNRIYGQTGL